MRVEICPRCNGEGKVYKYNRGPKPIPTDLRFWKKVDKRDESECWNWLGFVNKGNGYGQFSGYKTDKNTGAHRVAYELSTGELLSDLDFICHTCHNRKCCNPKHLYKGDALTNMQDMIKAGRAKHPPRLVGFDSPNTKVTKEQVVLIKSEWTGKNAVKLAKKYNLGRTTIGRIVNGKGVYGEI